MATLKRIGILGSGQVGTELAQKIAQAGFAVLLVDVKPEIIEGAVAAVRSRLDHDKADSSDILKRIQISTNPAELKSVDIVIEAVTEDRETKLTALRHVGEVCTKGTIFATSATTCRVKDIAGAVPPPSRFLGLHFFGRTCEIPFVEVIPGSDTAEATLRSCLDFTHALGCATAIVSDTPGGLVYRLMAGIFNEAIRLSSDGQVSLCTINAAAKQALGMPQGPFEQMNDMGIGRFEKIAEDIGVLKEMHAVPPRLKAQASLGAPWRLEGTPDVEKIEHLVRVFQGAYILCAAAIAQDEVASVEAIDFAAKLGLGWKRGPFEMAGELGMELVAKIVAKYAAERELSIPLTLRERQEKGTPWSLKLVTVEVSDGIATIMINRPDDMNRLNQDALEQLALAVNNVAQDSSVRAVVFTGTATSLAFGASPKWIEQKIRAGAIDEVIAFNEKVQGILRKIAAMEKFTATRLRGRTLGGGLELGLACRAIVSEARATFSFDEIASGIHCGLGGTQRLPRKVGKKIGKYLILTGEVFDARSAYRLGVVDAIIEDDQDFLSILEELMDGSSMADDDMVPTDEEISKLALFSAANGRSVLNGEVDAMDQAAKGTAALLSSRAPIALKLAEKLIDDGLGMELDRGLQWELQSLRLILGTDDALLGLGTDGLSPVVFTGK